MTHKDNIYPSSRRAALKQNANYYFTGKSCRYGHTTIRFPKSGECLECRRQFGVRQHYATYEKRKNKILAYQKHYYQQNSEKVKQRQHLHEPTEESKNHKKAYMADYQAVGGKGYAMKRAADARRRAQKLMLHQSGMKKRK